MQIRPFSVVKPVVFGTANLVSTDVPETDYAAWVTTPTSYSKGDRVIVVAGDVHDVYQSAANGNSGNNPLTTSGFWVRVSRTNRWKCADQRNSSQTIQTGGMYHRWKPKEVVTDVMLRNVYGDSARVQMIDPTLGTVYDSNVTNPINLTGKLASRSYFDWHYSRRIRRSHVLLKNLPPYYGADVRVDVAAATGEARLGEVMMGYRQRLGTGVKMSPRKGIQDWSRKTVNDFGDTVFQVLDFADTASFDLVVPNNQVDDLDTQITALRATPCLWIGSDDYRIFQIYGWYDSYELVMEYQTESVCSLSLKGMP